MTAVAAAGMRQVSVRALRAHWPSAAGVFLTMTLASALMVASGVLIESGLREPDPFSPTALMLPAVMGSFAGVALMLAVFVVSQAFAAALRDRRREFALLRAVGATGSQVRSLISTEVMAISVVALLTGGVAGWWGARALVPLLTSSGIVEPGFTPALSPWPVLGAAVLLLPAAWIAGRLAAREMARLSPTAAVSTSAADARTLSPGRIVAAWICAGAGLLVTLTPVFLPGAVGGAAGAASAFLFLTAVGLAGPALVLRAATWLTQRRSLQGNAATVLATANARGYSRRLTAAVVPLALLVSLGSVQTGVNRTVEVAAEQELGDALGAELVWQGSPQQAADAHAVLAAVPGVEAVATSGYAMVQVRTDAADEDLPFLDGLNWESGAVMVLEDPAGLVDPGVTAGDMADLAEPNTVAIAADGLMLPGMGLGDRLELRWPDGSHTSPQVVAVYERGLGLGGLIMNPATATASGGASVYVGVEPGAADAVASDAAEAGFEVVPTAEYIDAVSTGGDDSRLSNTLLFVLLAFVGIAAANALMIATRSRAGEFALLGRLGATRRQLRAMLGIEATLVGVGAVVIGTLTALPGLMAASLAMVRGFSLGLDPVLYASLAGATALIAFLGVAGARLRAQV